MISQVRPSDVPAWLQSEAAASGAGQAIVLDVREAWEVQTASIRPHGYALVAIPMGELPGRLAELDPTRSVACLCHHGARSLRVAAFLEHNGFERLANITGGIDAWSHENDPTVPRY
jgi:rhodanese-related sulfurtransferase